MIASTKNAFSFLTVSSNISLESVSFNFFLISRYVNHNKKVPAKNIWISTSVEIEFFKKYSPEQATITKNITIQVTILANKWKIAIIINDTTVKTENKSMN